MSSSYKIKVVAAGWEPAKKYFFQNCDRNLNSFFDGCYITVGVAIRTISYSDEFGERLSMYIWDINSSERFHFILPTFFRGAAACLLFYDISIPQSFEQLNHWIQHIRAKPDYVPIYIVAYKSQINEKTNFEEINDFVEANDINEFYLMSIRASQIFDDITARISEYIFSHKPQIPKTINEQNLYKKFILTFSRCPICLAKNHQSTLNRVFFSKDTRMKKFKEKLIQLMNFEDNYLNKIKIGVPCCSCHNKIFS